MNTTKGVAATHDNSATTATFLNYGWAVPVAAVPFFEVPTPGAPASGDASAAGYGLFVSFPLLPLVSDNA